MEKEKNAEITTIRVDPEVVAKIQKLKIHPNQSNNEILRKLLNLDPPKFVRADKVK